MKKLGKVLLVILEILLILYVVLITTFLLCKNKFGFTQIFSKTLINVNETNGADLEDYEDGTLLVVKSVKFNSVNTDDELFYYDSVSNNYVIRKGKVTDKTGSAYSAVYTINGISVSSDRIIGSLDKSYNVLGAVLTVLESRIGFLLIVILPIFVLFIYQVYKMVLLIKMDEKEFEK